MPSVGYIGVVIMGNIFKMLNSFTWSKIFLSWRNIQSQAACTFWKHELAPLLWLRPLLIWSKNVFKVIMAAKLYFIVLVPCSVRFVLYSHMFIYCPGWCRSTTLMYFLTNCRLKTVTSWWRHQMETFSALLAICEGNSPVPGELAPHKGQWRGALMFSMICVWINGCVNNREAGDLRRYRAHYDVIVMCCLSPHALPVPVIDHQNTWHLMFQWPPNFHG